MSREGVITLEQVEQIRDALEALVDLCMSFERRLILKSVSRQQSQSAAIQYGRARVTLAVVIWKLRRQQRLEKLAAVSSGGTGNTT